MLQTQHTIRVRTIITWNTQRINYGGKTNEINVPTTKYHKLTGHELINGCWVPTFPSLPLTPRTLFTAPSAAPLPTHTPSFDGFLDFSLWRLSPRSPFPRSDLGLCWLFTGQSAEQVTVSPNLGVGAHHSVSTEPSPTGKPLLIQVFFSFVLVPWAKYICLQLENVGKGIFLLFFYLFSKLKLFQRVRARQRESMKNKTKFSLLGKSKDVPQKVSAHGTRAHVLSQRCIRGTRVNKVFCILSF